MNLDFMKTYGEPWYRIWGTADNWPVWAQRYAARRAVRVRGFNPWPQTRVLCGV